MLGRIPSCASRAGTLKRIALFSFRGTTVLYKREALERIPSGVKRAQSTPEGAVAQLVERLLCKQEVTSSTLVGSTSFGATRRLGAYLSWLEHALDKRRVIGSNPIA